MSAEEPKEFKPGAHHEEDPAPQDETPSAPSSIESAGVGAGGGGGRSGDDGDRDGPAESTPDAADLHRLGSHLAQAMADGGYHPVILFGTNFSGKTSLLLSLFSTIVTDPGLQCGLSLCDPLLGGAGRVGRTLHDEADHTFSVKTQAFMEGVKIPKTNVALPFFIPVELRSSEGPPVRFAFLESNGEWYRPNRSATASSATGERLFPALRSELEDFIASYQGGMTFLYLLPYTQMEVYKERDQRLDADEVQSASLAIVGVLRAYDRIRANCRSEDRHLMLVTKWDAHSVRAADRAEAIEEDPEIVRDFCNRRYAQAIATFQGIGIDPEHRHLNAYCAGMINENGMLQLRHDDDARAVITSYPVKLWSYLYRNALTASDQPARSPFPAPPPQPFLIQLWNRLLGFVSGGNS